MVQQDSPFTEASPEKVDLSCTVTVISAVYDRRISYARRSYEDRVAAALAELTPARQFR